MSCYVLIASLQRQCILAPDRLAQDLPNSVFLLLHIFDSRSLSQWLSLVGMAVLLLVILQLPYLILVCFASSLVPPGAVILGLLQKVMWQHPSWLDNQAETTPRLRSGISEDEWLRIFYMGAGI